MPNTFSVLSRHKRELRCSAAGTQKAAVKIGQTRTGQRFSENPSSATRAKILQTKPYQLVSQCQARWQIPSQHKGRLCIVFCVVHRNIRNGIGNTRLIQI